MQLLLHRSLLLQSFGGWGFKVPGFLRVADIEYAVRFAIVLGLEVQVGGAFPGLRISRFPGCPLVLTLN